MANQWTTNTTANPNTTIGTTIGAFGGTTANTVITTGLNNITIGNGSLNAAIGSGVYAGTSATIAPQKVTYHVLGEDIEVSGYYDTNLIMIIATLNILKKPYYDELKKNRFRFPEEIDNCLRIGFRDNLIEDLMKPNF
jgi:hypothetical protein